MPCTTIWHVCRHLAGVDGWHPWRCCCWVEAEADEGNERCSFFIALRTFQETALTATWAAQLKVLAAVRWVQGENCAFATLRRVVNHPSESQPASSFVLMNHLQIEDAAQRRVYNIQTICQPHRGWLSLGVGGGGMVVAVGGVVLVLSQIIFCICMMQINAL